MILFLLDCARALPATQNSEERWKESMKFHLIELYLSNKFALKYLHSRNEFFRTQLTIIEDEESKMDS